MKHPSTPSDVSVTITACYALSLPEYHMQPHTHRSCEIMYVTSGSCTVLCSGGAYHLGANQFIFLPGGMPHRLEVESGHPCAILNLEFRCQKRTAGIPLGELFAHCPEAADFLLSSDASIVADDLRSMGYAMKDLIMQLQTDNEASDYLLRLLFYRTVLELVYCAGHDRKTAGLSYLKKACSYIERHLTEPLSVPAIAAHTGINKSYLQLLFSQFLGCPVGRYITQKRMEQAAFLLSNSSLGITDVAFSSGYNSRQHFAHIFEDYYHMNPSSYRKLHARTPVPDTDGARLVLDANGERRRQTMRGNYTE